MIMNFLFFLTLHLLTNSLNYARGLVCRVPLHVHSQFSILDACPTVAEIVEKAAEYGMPAFALTDHGNLFGAIDFYKACKENKIKPIIGCEFYVAPHSRIRLKRKKGKELPITSLYWLKYSRLSESMQIHFYWLFGRVLLLSTDRS